MYRFFISLVCSSVVLLGCSSSNSTDEPFLLDDNQAMQSDAGQCDTQSLNRWVDNNMRDYYYFADQTPVVDLALYDSPEELIRDLRVQPYDDFSYVTTIESNQNFFDLGVNRNLGFFWKRDGAGAPRISRVYRQSPMGVAGIKRGDTIVAVNGIAWDDLGNEEYVAAVGTADEPRLATWEFLDGVSGESKFVDVIKDEYAINTVNYHQSFRLNDLDAQIGYLMFTSFIENSADELDAVFAEFKADGVSELILDLRYNGGGRTSIARKLASLIAGPTTDDELLISYRRNARYQANNFSRYFVNERNALGLSRVIVLTTGSTASSSEIVINSLKPYIDVVTVGRRTLGKPYISNSVETCDRSMNAIHAEGFNANNISVSGGIEALCFAEDNPVTDFNIGNEQPIDSMTLAGLRYLRFGECLTPPTVVAATRSHSYGPTLNMGTERVVSDGD